MVTVAQSLMTPGRIAAIITCRDLGRTLVEALNSVERQTRPAAEIMIIDHESTDVYTRQTLARLEREGTRVVRITHRVGHGAATARNHGAQLTSSEYLVWLDADDTVERTYFEKAAARLDQDVDLDFVSCAIRAFGAASYVWTPSSPTFVDAVSTGGVPHASTMLRRRLWQRVGGFDEELPSYELLDFWASAFERGARGTILEEVLLNYRVRPGSGYRRSIQSQTYLSRLGHFYAKHREAVERHGLELIRRKEAFLLSQREHRQSLESRKASLEAEASQLRLEISEAVRGLESRGSARVDWMNIDRVQPLSPQWGWDRGKPIDRHYIEEFLDRHRRDIRGRVLEVRDSTYTERFGGDAVTTRDVVDIDPANQQATIIADLRRADAIPADTYDCIIITQTLQLVDDIPAVLAECARVLRPGGVLLATAPSVIRVDDEAGVDGDFWRLTEASARKLFAAAFPVDAFDVTAYGNVMACAAFLYGMSMEEMQSGVLTQLDSNFPLVVAVRAVKPTDVVSRSKEAVPVPATCHSGAILAYHRIATLTPDSHHLCLGPDHFRQHIDYIRREYSPIALDDLVRAAAAGRIPERAVAVTLDDGYLDALSVASPILCELGVPATFFVNTDRLTEEHERWWDMLERVFLGGAALPPLLRITVAGDALQMPTATAQERADALACLNRAAWPLNANARAELVAHVAAWSGVDISARTSHRVLTETEIRELASRPGHTIGAHTVRHLALTTQPADTRRSEIVDDKLTLERVLQQPVHLFSYPYGEFDPEIVTAVSQAGFRAAVTIQPGLVTAGTNRLLLPRHEIMATDSLSFPRRLKEIFNRADPVSSLALNRG